MKIFICAIVILLVAGCVNPPEGTILIDTDANLTYDALAWDRDNDGVADLTPEGALDIVAGSGGYAVAEQIDAVAPSALLTSSTITTLFGGGAVGAILAGLGAWWKTAKPSRMLMNLIMAVQTARQKVKDEGGLEVLTVLDDALATSGPETAKVVRDLKKKLEIASVE